MTPSTPHVARNERLLVYASFAVLYLVWGASFVVNKIMVGELPPLLSAGIRFIVGGAALVALARLRGAAWPPSALEWRHVAVMGVLTVVASNGINIVALRYVAANQSALLNSSSAFWIALLGTFGARGHALSRRTQLGLVLGFLGVVLVLLPRGGFSAAHLGWQLMVVVGCFAWALATLYQRTVRPQTAPFMYTGMMMIVGGVAVLLLGLANGDAAAWRLTARGLLALLYLIVFSSILGYAALTYLIPRTTPARLGTYAYVNPVIAALVAWALLGETLSPAQLVGSAVILAGVALVTLPPRPQPIPDEPAV